MQWAGASVPMKRRNICCCREAFEYPVYSNMCPLEFSDLCYAIDELNETFRASKPCAMQVFLLAPVLVGMIILIVAGVFQKLGLILLGSGMVLLGGGIAVFVLARLQE